MPTPCFRQADPQWGHEEIAAVPTGKKPKNLRRVGCLVTAVAEALRRSGDPSTPADVLARGKKAGAFIGADAILPRLAEANGLAAPREERVYYANGIDALRRALRGAVADAGQFAILWVDHDLVADGRGNHFVLAYGIDTERDVVHYADPATGHEHELSLSALEGTCPWKASTYRVLSVAPIRAPRRARPVGGMPLH